MPTDPAAPRHRRSIRLPGYDYNQAGAYFTTLCTHNREHLFGEIVNGEMVLNEIGQIVHDQWLQIPARFIHVELDAFVVMPNHFHAIMIINHPEPVGAGLAPAQFDRTSQPSGQPQGLPLQTPAQNDQTGLQSGQPQGLPLQTPAQNDQTARKTVGDIVGTYKSLVANECLKIYKSKNKTMGKIWQRNYYEHIIRDEKAYLEIAQYIFDNPAHWETDSEYT
ncbi:MAG: transposase [Bellilinea sp.]